MPDFKDFGEVDTSGGGGDHGGKWSAVAKGDPFGKLAAETPFSYDYYDSVTAATKFPEQTPARQQYEEEGPHGPDQMPPKRKGAAGSDDQPSHAGEDAKSRSNKEDRT